MHPTPPLPATADAGARLYRAGSLTYTKRGLFALSLWLLWGDFALYFFEAVFARFLPIYLKEFQASNTFIGVMTGSLAGLVNVLFLPGISRWSDSHRGRFGRRIPFLYVTTPLLAGTLILLGFAPEIGAWLFEQFSLRLPDFFTKGGVILGLMGLFVVSFHFFNMVLLNAYNWLIRDVVPLPVMARFLAWFRIVSTVSSVFFLWFVFPHLVTHRREICAGVGVFYLVAFLLMCRRVKEGDYPPPEKNPAHAAPGLLKTFAVYFRECWQIPLYRWFLIVNLLVTSALNCASGFTTLFVKEALGMDMGAMGHVFSWTAVVSALVFFPVGWICDRVSPLKVVLASITLLIVGAVAAALAVHGGRAYMVYAFAYTVPLACWNLGCAAAAARLFPSEKFGQFSGAMNVFGCGGLIVGNVIVGALMDMAGNNYRFAFVWTAALCLLALAPMVLVLREWRRHGGAEGYVPPLV